MLYWLTNKIILAYIISTSFFLLLVFFIKTIRNKANHFLNISNLILFISLIGNFILTGLNTIQCRTEELNKLQTLEPTPKYNFSHPMNCLTLFIWTIILGLIFQILFISRKYRTKIWTTITSVLLLLILQNLEAVQLFILDHFFSDYLPSSWSVYYESTDEIWTISLALIYFIFCWTVSAKKIRPGD